MSYLLDTNVISAVAPTRSDRPRALVDWLDRASAELYLSVVTSAEIREGIAKAQREGAVRKAKALSDWWNAVEHLYAERILAFDLQATQFCLCASVPFKKTHDVLARPKQRQDAILHASPDIRRKAHGVLPFIREPEQAVGQ